MDLIGVKVYHKSHYGIGEIISQKGNYITVKFDAKEKPIGFVFPDCFKSFLKTEDKAISETISAELDKKERLEKSKATLTNKAGTSQSTASNKKNNSKRFERNYSNMPRLKPFPSVEDFCRHYESEINCEIMYLKSNGGKRQKIYDGHIVESRPHTFTYVFESETELNYPADTQITIFINNTNIPGIILSCMDFTVILVTKVSLGINLSSIEFSAEPWRLLFSLKEKLENLRNIRASGIVSDLISNGRKNINSCESLKKGQENACELALTQPITFIWGPPGTGKTETLAKIAMQHMEKGNRVLMVSYSNVSVDGAALRVNKYNTKYKPGEIIRYGYVRDKRIINHKYLSSYAYVLQKNRDLYTEMEGLIDQLKKLKKDTPEYVRTQLRISAIKKSLLDEEKKTVDNARFVATTISKAIIDKTIYGQMFDVVIFDEASMAYIPQIVLSASLSSKHFICMGDFAQLPPIVQSGTASTLNCDIFDYCGIVDAVNGRNGHNWLCMLDVQYRMHPEIADFASVAMYRNLLKTSNAIKEELTKITEISPMQNVPFGVANLTGMMSVCTQTSDLSRINLLSALITFGLALQATKSNDVGIITPYHAQSRLLNAMSRDFQVKNTNSHSITCATVHQFQGSEKDVILYDAVDCYKMKYPGMLLTSTNNNYADRLFNVALTRARGKFISIANVKYLFDKKISKYLMFTKLLDNCITRKKVIEGDELCRPTDFGHYKIFSQTDATATFFNDIAAAKKEICIDIPGGINMSDDGIIKLGHLLYDAELRGVKIIIRAENKKDLPDMIREFAIENNYVSNPVTVIDGVTNWFGEPISSANFISEGITLNTLYRPIIRIHGRNTATAIKDFLEMGKSHTISHGYKSTTGNNNNSFSQYITENIVCRKCGEPMTLARNKATGKFFLGCSYYPSCDNNEMININTVYDYLEECGVNGLKCPKDGTKLIPKIGQFGIYVHCCGTTRHSYRLDEI